MATSLVRAWDVLSFTSSPTALKQTNTLYCQRQKHTHGTVQVDIADHSQLTGGDMFIIGRPNDEADWVTLHQVIGMHSLMTDSNGYPDIFLLPQMRILFQNVNFSGTVFISSWLLGD